MKLPIDYAERVYTGVLGKIIGVYLGRPFEGWGHEKILAEFGEINYYVHEQRKVPLIVPDDDISGTFTFLRALEDHGNSRDLTAVQIGQSWLNYIIENRTILWWGGMGNSTEHTAFMRLKAGIPAPRSGSIKMNGRIVAEQIGSQIFIDGWAMVAPGDPQLATTLAARAASVSHDGEAIYGAQVVAAMESLAFVESDLNKILDASVKFIPKESIICRMIADLRAFHAGEKTDWKKAFHDVMRKTYNYETYGGGCHMVPNHGLIILALLYGEDDFQKSLMIANTCGWDTDCNSANVGCFMGIKNGLAGIDAGPDWRGPVADRIFLPTADGGRCITDAATEAIHVVNMGRALAGEAPLSPKKGARFHFELPGSVQGFQLENSPVSNGTATLENVAGHSVAGKRSLAIHCNRLAAGRSARVATATFLNADGNKPFGYGLLAAPTLYTGQTVTTSMLADPANAAPLTARLYLRHYNAKDEVTAIYAQPQALAAGSRINPHWKIPATQHQPIMEIGIEISGEHGASGSVYLDYLAIDGEPDVEFKAPADGTQWRRSWIDGTDTIGYDSGLFRPAQNAGRGLQICGTRQWKNYRASTEIRPNLAKATGLAARVQGMKRYYAILIGSDGQAKIVKMLDIEKTLASIPFQMDVGELYRLAIEVTGNRIRAWADDKLVGEVTDHDNPLKDGGVAAVIEEGRTVFTHIAVKPA